VSVSAGYTVEEIRQLVHEYALLPYGQKMSWLTHRGLPYDRMRRWTAAVFEGDLDRGLFPREGGPVTVPRRKRTTREKARAREVAAHKAELSALKKRIRELEGTNDALGKAIGLLHAIGEQEPCDAPTTSGPSDSSTQRPGSSNS
jgi:hypothetical protein